MSGSLPTCEQCLGALADVEAIDFFLARELERQFGAPCPERFHLWLALHWALRQGHSCLDLAGIAGRTLWADGGADEPRPGYAFGPLPALRALLAGLDLSPEADRPVVVEGDRAYLRRYWRFETELAMRLRQRMRAVRLQPGQLQRARRLLSELFPNPPGGEQSETDWQAVAVANALVHPFSVLSGGPGTGKTYTVARLLATLQRLADQPMRIALATPTGKAKQRLQESIAGAKTQLAASGVDADLLKAIPEQAHTLHSLLGVRPNSIRLRYDADHPLPVDLLLIDEASMVDLPMMTRVLRALPDTARLVLVGDANQLPSIAVGSVLADLAPLPHPGYSAAAAESIRTLVGYSVPVANEGGQDPVGLLRKSHRFDGEGGVGRLAEAVINLDAAASWRLLSEAGPEGNGQLSLTQEPDLGAWVADVVERYYRPLLKAPDLDAAFACLDAFRLLVPMRRGPWGVEQLNEQIEQRLVRQQSGRHYHGRPIMVTRNHPALNLYNGDVGLVWRNAEGALEAFFREEAGLRRINLGLLPEVEPVYAMTVHKTQGSEFGRVALLLEESSARLLTPELLYTGITRAKKHCMVAAGEAVWKQALASRAQRWSGLRQRLGNEPRALD
ncbi:exodeoxyribonuclease V subunit alpha [Motiliproteus sp. SC1-56]|uniref:exodeoxyribonuclease V subunit alpha n=1 Tax=Motiliproteus sp. SC1-56 TaxID=2799565 RepID=UPI001A8FCB0B|nr:exodeoxyribonuclease V subunit alpha [Motiliproteus sp. SC1-56]